MRLRMHLRELVRLPIWAVLAIALLAALAAVWSVASISLFPPGLKRARATRIVTAQTQVVVETPSEFPAPGDTGLPAGWTPQSTNNGMTIDTPGQVVQDVDVKGDVLVRAANVTLRRVKVEGRVDTGLCPGNGLLVQDSTIQPPNGATQYPDDGYSMGIGGYTLDNAKILNTPDGPRFGGATLGCGTTTIKNSYVSTAPPANNDCNHDPAHIDGMQGYGAPPVVIRRTTIYDPHPPCGEDAGFFFPGGPDKGPNSTFNVNGLLIWGGGFSWRAGTPGSVQGLKIVDGSWAYGPVIETDKGCRVVSPWEAKIVSADMNTGTITGTVRDQPCING